LESAGGGGPERTGSYTVGRGAPAHLPWYRRRPFPGSEKRLVCAATDPGGKFYGFKAVTQADSGSSDVFVHAVATSRFFDASSKWIAHSKLADALMVVDSAASEAYLYLWDETNYDREQVNFQ
jgi:hypothetical protein